MLDNDTITFRFLNNSNLSPYCKTALFIQMKKNTLKVQLFEQRERIISLFVSDWLFCLYEFVFSKI